MSRVRINMEICMLCTVVCVSLECDVFDADLLFSF